MMFCANVPAMANKKTEKTRSGLNDAFGIIFLVLSALLLISLVSYDPGDVPLLQSPPNDPPTNLIGPLGAYVAFLVVMLFGVASYLFALAFAVQGGFLLFRRHARVWPKALWLLLLLLSIICMMEIQTDLWFRLTRSLNIANPGGLLGMLFGQFVFIRFIGSTGTAVLALAGILVSLIFLFEIESLAFVHTFILWVRRIPFWFRGQVEHQRTLQEEQEEKDAELEKERLKVEKAMRAKTRQLEKKEHLKEKKERKRKAILPDPPPPEPKQEPKPAPKLVPEKKKKPLRKAMSKAKPSEGFPDEEVTTPVLTHTEYSLPPYSLMDKLPARSKRVVTVDTSTGARVLEETMAEFNVEAEVTNVDVGPVVTSYEVLPAAGVRVERIAALSNNIALSMKAISVRVQAPIPGKGVVGIEVPNEKSTMVFLREVLEGPEWTESKAALPLVLGKDVSGTNIVADLAKMPHMLIAGATGAGKSVCMNSILAGLLMSRTPDQMKLMLVDPKMVEFSFFNELPHLVVPVITDPKKVSLGLRWAINEMDKRYKLFARIGVRNIQTYNERPVFKQEELFPPEDLTGDGEPPPPAKPADPDRLPYIVIVIDELADLMMVAQADVESAIARLAQLSRAVGIHMIIATQRPSVNVITGTIKANFPARLAFQVAQKVDSRTILDANGADTLLGKGDMLFLPPGTSKLVRAQGTMTSDDEIRGIVDFWKTQGTPQYELAITKKIESTSPELPQQDDDKDVVLLDQAVEILRQTRRASTSSLQRRLRIGYTRAARLMDVLEERGIVGPPNGSDPREILIDLDGDIPDNDAE